MKEGRKKGRLFEGNSKNIKYQVDVDDVKAVYREE